ncbi:hypothetical protein M5X17_27925 [Paenibacillus alvei]|uniref:hypothetical protein n=1 Tax=Paenibacillus alvei TaxID=44250 RepID=UPI0022831718|nr:hypothetical protein [Paenibacillus alvei]MCY9737536.1 hypothetical protein [Paenibacillus alvei]
MQKFYATGKKMTSKKVDGVETKVSVHVVIDNLPHTYVEAVNEANRIAKKEKITLDGVRIVAQTKRGGDTMTKGFKRRKKLRAQGKKLSYMGW